MINIHDNTFPNIEEVTDEEYELAHTQAKEFNLEPSFICLENEKAEESNHQEKQAAKAFANNTDCTNATAQANPSNHFEQRTSGLYHLEVDNKGDEKETWICSPVSVLGQTRDSESNAWGLLLEWKDPDKKVHRWAMPKALLVGRDVSAWLGKLVDEGLRVAPHPKAKSSLAHYLSTAQANKFILCVNATGWHGDKYVFPLSTIQKQVGNVGTVGNCNNTKAFFDPTKKNNVGIVGTSKNTKEVEEIVLQTNIAKNPYSKHGNFKEWQNTIGQWAVGNSRIILAICTSLSAVLLECANAENGGFNFVGGSSTGKTTTLCVGASVWGKGSSQGGYIQSWRATDNGLEGISCLHNDACLCLDELGQAPPKVVKEATYMLANGQGKSRARQDGTARKVKTWRTVILSTGEKTIAEKIADDGGKSQAGQLVRIVDISADAGAELGIFENLHGHATAKAFSEAIKKATSTHYGYLAHAFIQKLLDNIEARHEASVFINGSTHLLCDEHVDGQIQRVAKKFLLAICAGEMATEWGLLKWEQGTALNAIKKCFADWLIQRGGTESQEDIDIYNQITLFLEQHGKSRFQDLANPDSTCINRVGFRRQLSDKTEYFVLPQSFKSELCKGVSHERAVKVLHSKGLLQKGDGRNYTKKSPVPLGEFGKTRSYLLCVKDYAYVD